MKKDRPPIYREPLMQIRHQSLIFYSLPTQTTYRCHNPFKNYNNGTGLLEPIKTYSGNITKGAAKRIRNKVDMLLQLSPPVLIFNPITERHFIHTLSFITLTISAKERHLEAHEGHKLVLEPFLLRARRKFGLKTYIWKAEFQKNGQLHYHITTPSFIKYYELREQWNKCLSKAGLLSKWEGNDETGPNSTDIHAVYKIKNMQAYLTKYLSKSDSEKSTKGKVWDCSLNLKNAKFFVCPAVSIPEIFANEYETVSSDYVDIIKTTDPTKLVPARIKKEYLQYLQSFKS